MQLEFHQLDLKYKSLRAADGARTRRLMSSLVEHGQLSPVLVVEDGRRFVLIDGHVRVRALQRLGNDTVEGLILPYDETTALIHDHRLEHRHRRSALEEGWLVRELCEGHGLQLGEVAKRLGCSKSWVSRRMSLVNVLPEHVQGLVRKGNIGAHSAMKYLVPLARANTEHCALIADGIANEGVSNRQMERLYMGWRKGTVEQRAQIARAPALYLKALGAVTKDTPIDDPERTLLSKVESINNLLRMALRCIREESGPIHTLSSKRTLIRAWKGVQLSFATLDEEFEDDKSRHPHDSDPAP